MRESGRNAPQSDTQRIQSPFFHLLAKSLDAASSTTVTKKHVQVVYPCHSSKLQRLSYYISTSPLFDHCSYQTSSNIFIFSLDQVKRKQFQAVAVGGTCSNQSSCTLGFRDQRDKSCLSPQKRRSRHVWTASREREHMPNLGVTCL